MKQAMSKTESVHDRWAPLASLVLDNVPWLMERILEYARQHQYTRYTSTLVEAWRMSIEGLNQSLYEGMARYDSIPELGPDDSFSEDPLTHFGLIEARRHENRGVTLTMFLGLMKYYRQTYHDLLKEKGDNRIAPDDCALFLERCFDRMEIAFCAEWKQGEKSDLVQRLQETSRRMTNEKNTYLTLLESLEGAIIVINNNKLMALNSKANDLISAECRTQFNYYQTEAKQPSNSHGASGHWWLPDHEIASIPIENVFPWLSTFLSRNVNEDTITIQQKNATRFYDIRKSAMRDVSDKFTGTVLTLVDVTRRERFKRALQSVLTVHSEMHEEDLVELLPKVLEETARNFDSSFAACFLFEHDTDDATAVYCHGDTQQVDFDFTVADVTPDFYNSCLKKIIDRPEQHRVNDPKNFCDIRFPDMNVTISRMVIAAVHEQDQICLVLCAANKSSDYDDFELQHLQFLAENAWNIIAKKRAELVIEQRKKDVERLKRAESLAVLAGGVAHDFNNLLSVIQSHTRIVGRRTEQATDEKLRTSIEAILKAVEKGAEVTKTMRACTGTSLGPVTEEELGQLIHLWLSQNMQRFPEHIRFTTTIQDELPPVKLDKSQFPTILTNLIENAIDGIGDTSGQISISLEEKERSNDNESSWTGATIPPGNRIVQLCIQDTGKGMDEDTLTSAFDPFFTTKFVGRGLGLAAVRGLVIAHGGRVRIDSAPQKGATVCVEIPVVDRISAVPDR